MNSKPNVIKERISELKGQAEEFTQHITYRMKRQTMCGVEIGGKNLKSTGIRIRVFKIYSIQVADGKNSEEGETQYSKRYKLRIFEERHGFLTESMSLRKHPKVLKPETLNSIPSCNI